MSSTMNKTDQLDFWGQAQAQASSPTRTRKPAAPRKPAVPAPQAAAPAMTDPEAAAALLAQHPDYRVLRRLVPRLDWGPAPSPSSLARVIVLDTETTGLDARQERIIELAMLSVAVDRSTGQPVGPVTVYESFEDPGKPIPPAIQDITGIDDTMVQGQRIDDTQVQALVEAADLVLAHNAGFDRPFVEARLPVFATRPWNCSFAGIDWKREGSGSAKLEFLAAERGWFYDAHRAQVDCHALLQVLACPLGDGRTGLQQLIDGASRTRFKLRATGAPFDAKDALKARGYRWDNEGRVWWTSLPSQEAMEAECEWLKATVYGGRSALVQLEEQNSQVQFSGRLGVTAERLL